MRTEIWRWVLGLMYLLGAASIGVAASFVVQSVINEGASPFLITYICNSLFVIYIPILETIRFFRNSPLGLRFWALATRNDLINSEEVFLPTQNDYGRELDGFESPLESIERVLLVGTSVEAKEHWTRSRTAKVGLLVCPLWFFANFCGTLSLKYTTVTSNAILSSTSNLFSFFISLIFLKEKFTWIKLLCILLCMGGTIIVSIGDMKSGVTAINPLLGDVLAVISASLTSSFVALIRKKIPVDDEEAGRVSLAQVYGFLGLFTFLIFLPVFPFMHFTKLELFRTDSLKQLGLIVGRGLLDNVLGDYFWAKAAVLTTVTVATAGLTMEIPLAAILDAIRGNAPNLMDYLGALSILVGFVSLTTWKTEDDVELPSSSETAIAAAQIHVC